MVNSGFFTSAEAHAIEYKLKFITSGKKLVAKTYAELTQKINQLQA